MTDPHGAGYRTPLIVGIGGTTRAGSSTERALRLALQGVETLGGRTRLFGGPFLAELPIYDPDQPAPNSAQQALVDAVREADGLLIASPGYHGGVSGLVKNAIDLLEETAKDPRAYLDGVPVGLIVAAYGWQATMSTMASLRAIVHALRGWPTPLGVTINSSLVSFDAQDHRCSDPAVAAQLDLVASQVLGFIQRSGVTIAPA